MHRTILVMMLAAMSNSAMAEWVVITDRKADSLTVYADPTTILKTGNKVKMWSLWDFIQTQVSTNDDKYQSIMAQEEYDCKEDQRRTLFLIYRAENMGEGTTVVSYNRPHSDWEPAPPKSMTNSLLKFACQ
jgi:hypothetical protein